MPASFWLLSAALTGLLNKVCNSTTVLIFVIVTIYGVPIPGLSKAKSQYDPEFPVDCLCFDRDICRTWRCDLSEDQDSGSVVKILEMINESYACRIKLKL